MARVILITSREISTLLSKLDDYSKVKSVKSTSNLKKLFVSENIDAPFFQWCYRNDNNLLRGSKLDGVKRYNSENDETTIKSSYIISKIFNKEKNTNSRFEIPDYIHNKIFDEIKIKIGEVYKNDKDVKENYHDSDTYLGEIKYFCEGKTHFFVAHEFPDKLNIAYQNLRLDYMNALVSDILDEDNNVTIDDEWVFISHDKDWLRVNEGGLDKDIKSDENLRDKIQLEKGSKLRKIFEKENTQILIFQHATNSELYVQVIQNLRDIIVFLIRENVKVSKLLGEIEFINKKTFLTETPYKEIAFEPTKKIVHKVIEDIVNESRKEFAPVLIKGERTIKEMKTDKDIISDRRLNFLDSSIWIRYATEKNLKEVKDEILNFHNNGLYNLSKAKESKELSERLVLESRLDPMGGHGDYVIPFLFHSESEMKEAADEIISQIKNRKWRFLLVDDESYIDGKKKTETDCEYEKSLKNETEEEIETRTQCSRCKIISDVLSKDCNFICCCAKYENNYYKGNKSNKFNRYHCPCKKRAVEDADKINIEIQCVRGVKDAIDKLTSTEEYDIILMDYLLGYEDSDNAKKTREYSNEILQEVKDVFGPSNLIDKKISWLNRYVDNCEINKNNTEEKVTNKIVEIDEKLLRNIKGVNGRFWFFFISAYSIAVHERLLNEKFLHNTEYWHIEEGASPITTPHLFRYLLFSLMERQIQAITRLENKIDGITLLDLLLLIFENTKEVRQQAIINFNNIMRIRLIYDKIKYDVILNGNRQKKEYDIEKSPLALSLFPDIKYYDNAFWEHVMHLVYLSAYGTIRQWHDMWEEFVLIKPYLLKAYNDMVIDKGGQEISANPKAIDIIKGVERYILDLQKQSK